jgi:uncharacterized protein (DUF2126 family)
MKVLSPFTKLTPTDRVKKCADVVAKINAANSILQVKAPKRLEGYCLPKPNLQYSTVIVQPDAKGIITYQGPLK